MPGQKAGQMQLLDGLLEYAMVGNAVSAVF
jgi:hypothetical protein